MTDQIFPIKVQGAITRLAPPGRPDIEAQLHPAMEQGRMLEHSLGDGMFYLQDRMKDLQEKLNQYTNMNKLAVDGQFPDQVRPPKYVKDSLDIVKEIQNYTQATLDVVKAINETIGQYQSLKQNIQGYFQERSNALATLLHEICNFQLPSLPSIPNFFANFTFDGFTFPKAAFQFQLSFDKNFAFSQCHLRGGDIDIFRNYPKSIDIGGNVPVTIPVYRPPFSGKFYVNGQPSDVATITDTAYYTDFDPTTDYLSNSGFPNPAKIVSNYRIAIVDYRARLSSLVGSASLANIVTSAYDPNVVAAWIIELHDSRQARGGFWLKNFQTAYDTYIAPSYDYLVSKGIVWNNQLGGTGTQTGDPNIPIITILRDTPNAVAKGQISWMLAWIEASLLGLTRNQDYDRYLLESGSGLDQIVTSYLSDFTGSDLDYQDLVDPLTNDVLVALDSGGKALYPSVLKVSKNVYDKLKPVIDKASIQIEASRSFTSSRPQFRVVYDDFGFQKVIDKYSQFWKEFAYNWNNLYLSLDSYQLSKILNYSEAIDGGVNPLTTSEAYTTIITDSTSRDRSWKPGLPGLPIWVPDQLELAGAVNPSTGNGWTGDTFDPDTYLLRADIQGLTLNQKMAMVQINKAYASLRSSTQSIVAAIDSTIAGAAPTAPNGFKYEVTIPVNGVPSTGEFLAYDHQDYDNSGYYLDGTQFKITTAGSYSIACLVDWDTNADVASRIVAVIKNGVEIIATKQSDLGAAPLSTQADVTLDLAVNDLLKVKVYHNCLGPQVVKDSVFTVTRLGAPGTVGSTPGSGTGGGAGTELVVKPTSNIVAGTCLKINTDMTATPIDPTNAGSLPFIDALSLVAGNSGEDTAVANIHGEIYTITGASFTVGPLFLGMGGVLTQTMPTSAGGYVWYVQVGRAINATTIILDSQLPIQLS